MEYERFFAELTARLDAAGKLEREFDRKLAHRFNIFDYLRKNSEQDRVPELRLSRIIAHLLDPRQTHGQGTLFLRAFLDSAGLNGDRGWPDVDGNEIAVDVETEHSTRDHRSIDIFVEIVADKQRYCLAIENKPYADDLENQVQDYLKYLSEEHLERFLLIYLSPNGEGPSEESVPRKKLVEWKGRFAIMPYSWGQPRRADHFDAFRNCGSLADWLEECRKNCDAERLRWFLEDFRAFCETIGGQTVISKENEAAVKFVLSSPDNLKTAQVVYDSWSDVLGRVGPTFLQALSGRIEAAVKERETLKAFAHDICVRCQYGPKAYKSNVRLYRKRWTEYPEGYPVDQELNRQTCIRLENQREGPSDWIVGVSSPMDLRKMPGDCQQRQQDLKKEITDVLYSGRSTDWWLWYSEVNADKDDWRHFVPDLHREGQAQAGEIMTYFVDKFIEVAEKAVPVINDIEGSS